MTTYTGWHFLESPTQLANGGGPVPPVGQSISIKGEPILCEYGFHASEKALDALNCSPGPWLERIRLEGVVIVGDDKAVGTRRVSLSAPVNIERELRVWGCDEAERVLPLFEARYPGDVRPRRAIEISRRFAVGQATLEKLIDARNAAWDAAEDVAEAGKAAARNAARAAAWAAAEAAWAAWDAARTAARAAAEAAWADVWAAVRAADWAADSAAARDTASAADQDAARSAARDAECARQEQELAVLFCRMIGK